MQGWEAERRIGTSSPAILNPFCLGGRAICFDEIILFPMAIRFYNIDVNAHQYSQYSEMASTSATE